ncbi:MAG: hypothetical protein JSS00_13375 [Proteobacteria bacterium]|nr:hypothetical protein [Pseudomonadota bacterium]
MRTLLLSSAAAALSCGVAFATAIDNPPPPTRSPFPVQRGTAPPPPALGPSTQTPPPEGQAPGGIDFGLWRGAESAPYSLNFSNLIAAREQGRDAPQVRADLEANGFACEDAMRLDCRIEIREQACSYEWYVVVEAGRAAPVAAFEKSCGARR